MKYFKISFLFLSSILLVACSEKTTTETTDKKELGTTVENISKPTVPIEEPKIEIINEQHSIYNEYNDEFILEYYAEIKNTSDKKIFFDGATVTIKDGNGEIVDVEDFVDTYYPILNPGESSYLYSMSVLSSKPEGVSFEVNPDIEFTNNNLNELEVKDFELKKINEYETKLIGKVILNDKADSVTLRALLKDKDGKIISLVTDYKENLKIGENIVSIDLDLEHYVGDDKYEDLTPLVDKFEVRANVSSIFIP